MATVLLWPRAVSRSHKLVSTNDRPSYYSIIFRLFSSGAKKKKMRPILHEPVGGTPRHVCRKIRAKNRRPGTACVQH